MEFILERYLLDITRKGASISGLIKNEEAFNDMLMELNAKGYDYSKRCSDHRKTGPDKPCVRIDDVRGIPYTNGPRMHLDCVHGEMYYKLKQTNDKQEHPKKKSRNSRSTKKMGCQSKMVVRVRHVFKDYLNDEPRNLTKWQKIKISKELNENITAGLKPSQETWYYIDIVITHNHDVDIAGRKLNTHSQVKAKIIELVQNGVTSIPDIKVKLKEEVEHMFKDKQAPDITNSAFFPNDVTIYNYVYRTLLSMKCTDTNLEVNDIQWSNDDYLDADDSQQPLNQFLIIYEEVVDSEVDAISNVMNTPIKEVSSTQPPENQLCLVRQKLKNILDLTFNLEEGNYEDTLKCLSEIEENLSSRQKLSQENLVLSENSKKRKRNAC